MNDQVWHAVRSVFEGISPDKTELVYPIAQAFGAGVMFSMMTNPEYRANPAFLKLVAMHHAAAMFALLQDALAPADSVSAGENSVDVQPSE